MPKKRNFLGGMQNYNPNNGEYESRLVKEGGEPATKENMPGGEDKKSKTFKKFGKDKKPTDYEGVEKTSYGYIYNVNGESITDLKEERRKMGMPVVEGEKYGFSYTKNGDEVIVDTFEEAYNAVKGKKTPSKDMSHKEPSIEEIENEINETSKKLASLKNRTNSENIKSINEGKNYEYPEEYKQLSNKMSDLIKKRDELRVEKSKKTMEELGLKDYSKDFDKTGNFINENLKHSDRLNAFYQLSISNPSLDIDKLIQNDVIGNRNKYQDEIILGDSKYVLSNSGKAYEHFRKNENGEYKRVSTATIYGLGNEIKDFFDSKLKK